MAAQPDLEQSKQLAGYLRDSLNGRDPNAQRNATLVSNLFTLLCIWELQLIEFGDLDVIQGQGLT